MQMLKDWDLTKNWDPTGNVQKMEVSKGEQTEKKPIERVFLLYIVNTVSLLMRADW